MSGDHQKQNHNHKIRRKKIEFEENQDEKSKEIISTRNIINQPSIIQILNKPLNSMQNSETQTRYLILRKGKNRESKTYLLKSIETRT